MASVVGTEITKEAMEPFIQARWRKVTPPVASKKSWVFLLRFKSTDDMNRILKLPLSLIFDRPLLMKKYEIGMCLGKGLFIEIPVWIRFPGIRLELWTPTILSKMASKIWTALLADSETTQKTRLGAPHILMELHQAGGCFKNQNET